MLGASIIRKGMGCDELYCSYFYLPGMTKEQLTGGKNLFWLIASRENFRMAGKGWKSRGWTSHFATAAGRRQQE